MRSKSVRSYPRTESARRPRIIDDVVAATLANCKKVAVYCSDVAGAFDKVAIDRITAKLKVKKVRPELIKVLTSRLRQRTSREVVGGAHSEEMVIKDMAYQGTVLGPTLWNLFCDNARTATNDCMFEEVAYADDLKSYRTFNLQKRRQSRTV